MKERKKKKGKKRNDKLSIMQEEEEEEGDVVTHLLHWTLGKLVMLQALQLYEHAHHTRSRCISNISISLYFVVLLSICVWFLANFMYALLFIYFLNKIRIILLYFVVFFSVCIILLSSFVDLFIYFCAGNIQEDYMKN